MIATNSLNIKVSGRTSDLIQSLLLGLNLSHSTAMAELGNHAQEGFDVWSSNIFSSFLQLVTLDGGNQSNRAAVHRLKPIVEERREKMKEEMMGKFLILYNSLGPQRVPSNL